MNYIAEIKAFHGLAQDKQLSTGQIALWYALMYINNRCNWAEWFTVANISLQLNSGLSRQGVIKTRNALKQIGLIDFKCNGTKATLYKMCHLSDSVQASIQDGIQVGIQDGIQDGIQVGIPLTKPNQTKQRKENIKEKKPDKISFAESVKMTEAEYQKLCGIIDDGFAKECIRVLDNYKVASGKKYASDYRAILNWVVDKVKAYYQPKPSIVTAPTPHRTAESFDNFSLEQLLNNEDARDGG